MSKKAESKERRLMVIDSQGERQPFLRGMITHDLVLRGLDFESAYAAARSIRDRLSGREEVTTSEVREAIRKQLHKMYGDTLPVDLDTLPARPQTEVTVIYQGQPQPFSRGLLARSLYAAGVDLDRAYRLVTDLEESLREEGCWTLSSEDIARRVGELLERSEGRNIARRYWTLRRIHHLQRPIVVYVGGASGTGKSTLALELAPFLRFYRVTATDTIRQMMRMFFSPEMLPSLYSSSFEVPPAFGPEKFEGWGEKISYPEGELDEDIPLIASFQEQATRVAVGVRAVVDRAVAENMSILIEGVHLYPPLVPFPDLQRSAYQVPFILALPEQEAHRRRFLSRAKSGARQAERYLSNFRSIRKIQDFLLDRAENYDVPWIESTHQSLTIEALRLVTGTVQRMLPRSSSEPWKESPENPPTLLLIIDGLADRPVRALGGRTPLQAAVTPTFDRLAKEGRCGLADPVAPGVVPDTAAGSLALFGQNPFAMKRGPVEALGAGLDLEPGDIALRGNFATLDEEGRVIDRRAGRIREGSEELAEAIDRLELPGDLAGEVEVRVQAATEHRLAIVLRGLGLASGIHGSDPGEIAAPEPPLIPRPENPNDEPAVLAAQILALFEQRAREILTDHPINAKRIEHGLLPANAILTRGAGRVHRLVPLRHAGIPLRIACIAGDRTILGLARWLGAESVHHEEKMTANLDTDLSYKLKQASKALKRQDLAVVHVKGADVAAHDRRPDLKVSFLERLDSALGRFLDKLEHPIRIAVAADHATLSESGQHGSDPLPVLIWGEGIEADKVETYDETSAINGSLRRFPLQMLLSKLFEIQ